jgi:hypothetical protein
MISMIDLSNPWIQFLGVVLYLTISCGIITLYFHLGDGMFDDGEAFMVPVLGGIFWPITLLPVLAIVFVNWIFVRYDE